MANRWDQDASPLLIVISSDEETDSMDVECTTVPSPKPSAKENLYSAYACFAKQQVEEDNEQ